MTFVKRSFDLDVISIVFKYRPYTSGFPNQLNTNFNAAGFIGHRSDLYLLTHEKSPINSYQRRIDHFAVSFGGFIGLGATQVNSFVTENIVQAEYDGVVITKGLAAMIGIGQFTFGATLGVDHLTGKHHKFWIYQAKPWGGLCCWIQY